VVLRDGGEVSLTRTEVRLLLWFAERTGRALPREALLTEVWGYAPGVESRAPDNTIARLRTKIEADPKHPEHLLKVYGVGYRFEYTPAEADVEEAEAAPDAPTDASDEPRVGLDLFREQARRVRWDFALTPAEVPVVEALIQGPLAGEPLAVTLAASQAGRLTTLEIAERLTEHLQLAATRDPVDGTLGWCRGLLAPAERAAMAQCAVFRASFTLEAAEAVLDLSRWPDLWTLDVLQTLRDQALLVLDGDDLSAPGAPPRFALLPPLQAPALADLRGGGAYDGAVRRHLRWHAALAEAALGADDAALQAALKATKPDLTAAVTRALSLADPDLADATGWCYLGLAAGLTADEQRPELRDEILTLVGLSDALCVRLSALD